MKSRTRFVTFARAVARNAAGYRTKRACELMLARVKAAFLASGGYGCEAGERAAAIAACQDRWAGLDSDEYEARPAALTP
jgi:hypothetical protein